MLVNIHFSKHHIWKPSLGPQKSIMFNNNTLFLCISLPSAHYYDVKVPNFTFCGGREKRLSFPFHELRYSQSRILLHKNLLTFDELNEVEK